MHLLATELLLTKGMSTALEAPEASPASLQSIIGTELLVSRPLRRANHRAERAAFHELTNILGQGRTAILKRLARLGLELCDAGTAGVSILEKTDEGEIFRWQALAGELASYQGGSTPRNFSPCGSCLDAGKPILYVHPARRFAYFNAISTLIEEGLVIPFYENGIAVGTVWIVSHDPQRVFDAEDLRIMMSLAQFAGAWSRGTGSTRSLEAGFDLHETRESAWKSYLGRIARNDHAALNALFREAHPLVFSTALRILALTADADEVAADVFSRLWSAGYAYDTERGSATGWITSITRNLAFDRLRSRAREELSPTALYAECTGTNNAESLWLLAENEAFVAEGRDHACRRSAPSH